MRAFCATARRVYTKGWFPIIHDWDGLIEYEVFISPTARRHELRPPFPQGPSLHTHSQVRERASCSSGRDDFPRLKCQWHTAGWEVKDD
jgi:hypothetical protein